MLLLTCPHNTNPDGPLLMQCQLCSVNDRRLHANHGRPTVHTEAQLYQQWCNAALLSGTQDESRAKQLTAQLERSSAALAAAKQALADETTEARAAQVRPQRP